MLNQIIQISCGFSLYFYLTVLSGTYIDHFSLFTSTVQYSTSFNGVHCTFTAQYSILVQSLGSII